MLPKHPKIFSELVNSWQFSHAAVSRGIFGLVKSQTFKKNKAKNGKTSKFKVRTEW